VNPTLTFLGGAGGTVTGSKHLLENGESRVLLDCGLFQGLKELRQRNWAAPPVDSRTLGAVILSHAHIDHSGYLPRLCRDGFTGPIYCTPGTSDLLQVMLPDAAHLQEEEAAFANRHRTSKHDPALPLYTIADAERALAQVKRVDFGQPFTATRGVEARFTPSGHILGAGLVTCEIGGRRLVFSGDLGRYDVPIMVDPEPVAEADVLLVESTYGNRVHPPDDPADRLTAAVRRAVEQKGWLLIPAFAVGRSQEILYDLRELEKRGAIPSLPVFLDSPMGIQATAIYAAHTEEHDPALARVVAGGTAPFAPKRFTLSRTVEGLQAPERHRGPRHHRGGQRHGHRRPHPPPPQAPAARSEDHGALRRLPGGGHAGPAAQGRRRRDPDARHDGPGERHDHGERRLLRPRRSRGDPALARRVQAPARDDVRGPRRGGRGGGAAGGDREPPRLGWNAAVAQDGQRVTL
jgi:metallo-beta-lactamase family protein